MNRKNWGKQYFALIILGGLIAATWILGSIYNVPVKVTIPIILVLSLSLAAMALWTYANRDANGSEWWQDDNASGWRGY